VNPGGDIAKNRLNLIVGRAKANLDLKHGGVLPSSKAATLAEILREGKSKI
jgi:hypothetical protein